MPTERVLAQYQVPGEKAAWVSSDIEFLRGIPQIVSVLDRISKKDKIISGARPGVDLRDPNISPSIWEEEYNNQDTSVKVTSGIANEIPRRVENLKYHLGMKEKC